MTDTGAYGVIRWAREQVPMHGLLRGPAHALLLLASYCDPDTAVCFPGLGTLAADAGVKPKQLERDIAVLGAKGIVCTRRRRNQSAVRYLTVPWSPYVQDGRLRCHADQASDWTACGPDDTGPSDGWDPQVPSHTVGGDPQVPSGELGWDTQGPPDGTQEPPGMGLTGPVGMGLTGPPEEPEEAREQAGARAHAPARAQLSALELFCADNPASPAALSWRDARRFATEHFGDDVSAVAAAMRYGDDHDLIAGYLAATAEDETREAAA
jgi:hypothetical protein